MIQGELDKYPELFQPGGTIEEAIEKGETMKELAK